MSETTTIQKEKNDQVKYTDDIRKAYHICNTVSDIGTSGYSAKVEYEMISMRLQSLRTEYALEKNENLKSKIDDCFLKMRKLDNLSWEEIDHKTKQVKRNARIEAEKIKAMEERKKRSEMNKKFKKTKLLMELRMVMDDEYYGLQADSARMAEDDDMAERFFTLGKLCEDLSKEQTYNNEFETRVYEENNVEEIEI